MACLWPYWARVAGKDQLNIFPSFLVTERWVQTILKPQVPRSDKQQRYAKMIISLIMCFKCASTRVPSKLAIGCPGVLREAFFTSSIQCEFLDYQGFEWLSLRKNRVKGFNRSKWLVIWDNLGDLFWPRFLASFNQSCVLHRWGETSRYQRVCEDCACCGLVNGGHGLLLGTWLLYVTMSRGSQRCSYFICGVRRVEPFHNQIDFPLEAVKTFIISCLIAGCIWYVLIHPQLVIRFFDSEVRGKVKLSELSNLRAHETWFMTGLGVGHASIWPFLSTADGGKIMFENWKYGSSVNQGHDKLCQRWDWERGGRWWLSMSPVSWRGYCYEKPW